MPGFRRSPILHATVDGTELKLDLYLPDNVSQPPLLVWVHGGAWQAGPKNSAPTSPFVDSGYAPASLSYRLSPVAEIPAQTDDIETAMRFLRANASEYGYDTTAIGVMGASARGHMAIVWRNALITVFL